MTKCFMSLMKIRQKSTEVLKRISCVQRKESILSDQYWPAHSGRLLLHSVDRRCIVSLTPVLFSPTLKQPFSLDTLLWVSLPFTAEAVLLPSTSDLLLTANSGNYSMVLQDSSPSLTPLITLVSRTVSFGAAPWYIFQSLSIKPGANCAYILCIN